MTPRNSFLLGLSVLILGEIALGATWVREIKTRQASLLHADERMMLTAQLSLAEGRAHAARDRLNAALEKSLEATGRSSASALVGTRFGNSGAFAAHFRDALKNPDFARKLAAAQTARLGREYGPLFATLDLNADQLAKFSGLLLDKQLAKTEGRPLDVVDTQLQATLGDAGYETYVHYEDTARLRDLVGKVGAGLSATSTPLSADAANKLVETWYAALPLEAKGHPTGPSAEVGAGLVTDYELPPMPANSAELAQGILSQPQLAAFQRLIKAQAAQEELRGSQ